MPVFTNLVKSLLPEEKFVTATITYDNSSLDMVESFTEGVAGINVDPYKRVHTVTAGISKKRNCYIEIDGQRAVCPQETAERVHRVAKLVNTVLAYR